MPASLTRQRGCTARAGFARSATSTFIAAVALIPHRGRAVVVSNVFER